MARQIQNLPSAARQKIRQFVAGSDQLTREATFALICNVGQAADVDPREAGRRVANALGSQMTRDGATAIQVAYAIEFVTTVAAEAHKEYLAVLEVAMAGGDLDF